jgi:hypothetical protein
MLNDLEFPQIRQMAQKLKGTASLFSSSLELCSDKYDAVILNPHLEYGLFASYILNTDFDTGLGRLP